MTWHLVVIDERNRFALHLWRYLSRSLGYGTGQVSVSGNHEDGSTWIKSETPSEISHIDTKLWWIPADAGCQGAIERIFDKIPTSKALVIVDMHGDTGSCYDHNAVLKHLHEVVELPLDHILLVSAFYPSQMVFSKSTTPLRIWPKTSDTLRQIRSQLTVSKDRPKGRDRTGILRQDGRCHILVSGAGFEIAGERGGFGLPPTEALLNNMKEPFYVKVEDAFENGIKLKIIDGGFPIPENDDETLDKTFYSVAKEEPDLDKYWNVLLEFELKSLKWSEMEKAVDRETSMREAFRRTMVDRDWGYLNQSLCAARLDWHTWLTTNYTHFANRSIALVQSSEPKNGQSWSIVSTSSEALVAMRRVFGQASADQGNSAEKPAAESNGHLSYRYLFKLHGDIAHLNTMAIAGYDKKNYSPLTVPVDSLYQIYTAAEKYLEETLVAVPEKGKEIVWHVVGHGLRDRQLLDLMKNVVERSGGPARHVFRIVDKYPSGPISRLVDSFQSFENSVRIEVLEGTAADYLFDLDEKGVKEASAGVRAYEGKSK